MFPDPTRLRVLGLVLDSPAARAGVKQGDELVSVDGVETRNKSAFQAVSLIQASADAEVAVGVRRPRRAPKNTFLSSAELERVEPGGVPHGGGYRGVHSGRRSSTRWRSSTSGAPWRRLGAGRDVVRARPAR